MQRTTGDNTQTILDQQKKIELQAHLSGNNYRSPKYLSVTVYQNDYLI